MSVFKSSMSVFKSTYFCRLLVVAGIAITAGASNVFTQCQYPFVLFRCSTYIGFPIYDCPSFFIPNDCYCCWSFMHGCYC